MPLFLPVNFEAALPVNQKGALTEEQAAALIFSLKNRSCVGWLLVATYLFMFAIASIGALVPDETSTSNTAGLLWVFAGCAALGLVYGWAVANSAKKAKQRIREIQVEKITGETFLYNYSVPVKYGTQTHSVAMRHGYVRINGKKYAVLNPELYKKIVPSTTMDFYCVPLKVVGGVGEGTVVNVRA